MDDNYLCSEAAKLQPQRDECAAAGKPSEADQPELPIPSSSAEEDAARFWRRFADASRHCAMTLEDCHFPVDEDIIWGEGYRYNAVTREPQDWANVLFDPLDVIEIRCWPSKAEIDRQDSRGKEFRWFRTAKRHQLKPWHRAIELQWVVNHLLHLNSGNEIATFWANGDRDLPPDWESVFNLPLNIHCGVNPRRYGGTTAHHVTLARCLFLDLDRSTLTEAVTWLASSALPPPTLIVNSGHGVHAYWRFTEPLYDLKLWTRLQRRLAATFNKGDRSVHDAPRMTRIPGFQNVNGEVAACTIHGIWEERRYDIAEFLRLLPEPTVEEGASPDFSEAIDISDYPIIAAAADDREILRRMLKYERKAGHLADLGRNSNVYRLACKLTEGFAPSLNDLLQVTQDFNTSFIPPLTEGELNRVTTKAFNHVHRKGKATGRFLKTVKVAAAPAILNEEQAVSLDDWRNQMKAAKNKSLNHPGQVFFDGSPCGAGKSYSDQEIMRADNRTATFLPTHDACRELEKELQDRGINAAAHPPLNEETCDRFGTDDNPGDAQVAQRAGLDVTKALCPECPFNHAQTCVYQKRRDQARNADHVIGTHTRASLSDYPGENAQIVFIHEEPLALLRPSVTIHQRHSKYAQATLADLDKVIEVAPGARRGATKLTDQKKIAFSELLADTTADLARALQNPRTLLSPEQADAPLAALPKVIPIPLQPRTKTPRRYDKTLFEAMSDLQVFPKAAATKLAVAYAAGELLTLALVIEEPYGERAKKPFRDEDFSVSLIGVWKSDPPTEPVVWFEYANGDHEQLADLLGRPVNNTTPQGFLKEHIPPIQYPHKDVTTDTSGGILRGLVRAVLCQYPTKRNVGLITHKCHLPEIEKLEPFFKERIKRKEYFRSGKDKASNGWLDNDLIIVLGTPRVPVAAVREGLIRLGKIDAALADGQWKSVINWYGTTTEGVSNDVEGSGYRHPDWQKMHNLLVKDQLRQAIGRGRAITDRAVQVVVISNEELGLPLAPSPLLEITDTYARTFLAVCALLYRKLTADNAYNSILAFSADSCPAHVLVKELVPCLGLADRTVREHVALLESLGLLDRRGERGGIVLSDAAFAHPEWCSVVSGVNSDGGCAAQG